MSQSSNFRSLMSDKALPISGARLSLMVTIIRPHISLNGIRRFPACVCMLYRRWYYFYMSAAILRQIPHVQWILVPRIRIGNVTEGIWFCIFHSALLALRVIAMRAKGFAQTLFARYALRWVCYTCWFFFVWLTWGSDDYLDVYGKAICVRMCLTQCAYKQMRTAILHVIPVEYDPIHCPNPAWHNPCQRRANNVISVYSMQTLFRIYGIKQMPRKKSSYGHNQERY